MTQTKCWSILHFGCGCGVREEGNEQGPSCFTGAVHRRCDHAVTRVRAR